ncbi:SDR family oxidoreductase [uncultured Jatrophihabitans sp.]|uniref:SDR family oxidoreductase n=1 Tax=uncultured Jatrophihabitans sp. TaxID=1610747 RepID=UPI0035C988E4
MPKQPRQLSNKVAVVTGGARGIGAKIANTLARQGMRVAICDLDLDVAERTAKEIGDVGAYALDVTDHAAFTAFLDTVERDLGPIDVLVNNAGIMPLSLIEDEDDAITARQLAINLGAVIHGSREAVRRMKPRGSGHLVNIASVAGKVGAPGAATYCATKHGVVGFSEAVYFELRGTGVDVTCVMPSITNTELASGLGTSRLTPTVEPQDVADVVLHALQHPHLEAYVPRNLAASNKVMRLFPRAVLDRIGSGKAGSLLASAAHSSERTEYETRAAGRRPS